MLDASTSGQVSRSVQHRAKLRRNCCIGAVTVLRAPREGTPFAGKKAPLDLILTMEVLYQLSYVGAKPES